MQQKVTIAEGLELDFSGLFAPAEQASKPETTASAEPNVFAEEDALIDQGYKKVLFEDTPFAQASEKPSRPAQSSPAKESKPSTLQATGAASRPQKKPLLDSSGTINYSKYERVNHEFLARHNPPPIDEAYYKGLSEDDLRAVAKAFEEALYTLGMIDYLPYSPMEQAYWEDVKRDQFETSRENAYSLYLHDLLMASRTALEGDYIRQLEDCLKSLHAFDLLEQEKPEPETACKGE